MNFDSRLLYSHWKNPGTGKRFVSVNSERLVQVAEELSGLEWKTPDWRIPNLLPENDLAFVSHTFWESVVDHSFLNSKPRMQPYKVDGFKGSQAMAHCFYRRFGEKEITADDILEITENFSDTEKFFAGATSLPLLEERFWNLREAAKVVKREFGGLPMEILRSEDFVIEDNSDWYWGILYALAKKFPRAFGKDWYGLHLAFHKRAQLWLALYHGRAVNSNGRLTPLKDPENIGPIIDYRVPNALRHLGILEYRPELAQRVDSYKIIHRHERAELEIRVAASYAMIEILNQINESRAEIGINPITMVELDYWAYQRGKKSKYPPHLCHTTDY